MILFDSCDRKLCDCFMILRSIFLPIFFAKATFAFDNVDSLLPSLFIVDRIKQGSIVSDVYSSLPT